MAGSGSKAESLKSEMITVLGPSGVLVSGVRGSYMEITEAADGMVWMSREPVELADFKVLNPGEAYRKMGIGRAAMDRAGFIHSPNRENEAEAVREREVGGHAFINVAIPTELKPPSAQGGPVIGYVNKAHVLGFAAGRKIAILTTPEGDFVEVVGEGDADANLVLPEGGRLSEIELAEDWIVTLPTPTRVFFWFGESMRSFQGPVTKPGES